MLRNETQNKIDIIIQFIKTNVGASYSISDSSIQSENSLSITIVSTGEYMNVITNVNVQSGYPFFSSDNFSTLNIVPENPVILRLKSSNK